jgi:hypothetical protein
MTKIIITETDNSLIIELSNFRDVSNFESTGFYLIIKLNLK